MPIQHSSNFSNALIRNTMAILEIAQERLMERISSDAQKYVDVFYTSANLFAQEMEGMQRSLNDKDTIIKNMKKDIDGMCSTIDRLQGESLSTYREKEELKKEVERLRELNNNQAWLIASNRTKRSDFHV